MTPLAAIMKSSMSSLARFFSSAARSRIWSRVEHRPRLDGFQVERAVLVPERLELLRRRVLQPQVGLEPRDRGDRLRHRPVAVEPGRDAVVGELGVVADQGLVDVGTAPRSRPVAIVISTTTAGRSCCSVSEVRSVESRSGSIGKISAAV